jgi:hypothetical protein
MIGNNNIFKQWNTKKCVYVTSPISLYVLSLVILCDQLYLLLWRTSIFWTKF